MIYRDLLEYPGYEMSVCGVVRRKERKSRNALKPDLVIAAQVMKRVGRRQKHVVIGSNGWVHIDKLYEATWADMQPIPGGIVVTVDEWITMHQG